MKILKITDNPDGSATMEYELTPIDIAMMKKISKGKRLTKKRINGLILNGITNYVEQNQRG